MSSTPQFLGQQWRPGEITEWRAVADVLVDSASICITPRAIADGISGDGLLEAEGEMQAAADMRRFLFAFALDGHPAIAAYVSAGDGCYPLRVALDRSGQALGWDVDFRSTGTAAAGSAADRSRPT